MIQILELFGGIGSPRCALRNIGIPVKAIDYVEIDEKAVRSYNAMFADELPYKTQSVVGWNLKPDILIHGSPCQDFSIAGHQGKAKAEDGRINRGKGADKGSGTRSSLMWETIHIIEQMGEWKPQYVIWENVKNVLSKYMRVNFNRYLAEMERLGYSNNFEILDARDFGLPQARERVFTVSVLGKEKFIFDDLIKTPMQDINKLLLQDAPPVYDVTQPSVLEAIGQKGIRRATVIEDYAFTITARQDRTPAQVIDMGNGRYRYLTELECWRLQGYSDADFEAAAAVHKRNGRYTMPLYKQAGNSILEGKAEVYVGYLAAFKPFADHEISEEYRKYSGHEVKKFRAVPEITHRRWKELGLMKPLEPDQTAQYKFSDLQMSLYYTIYIQERKGQEV